MKKKADISVNIIVIAAIGLLVLVVLSVIFISQLGQFGQKVGECENKGGTCVLAAEACPPAFPTAYSDWTCETVNDEARKCCIKVTA